MCTEDCASGIEECGSGIEYCGSNTESPPCAATSRCAVQEGWSFWSLISATATAAAAPTSPTKPVVVTATRIGATLSWGPPEEDGGSAIQVLYGTLNPNFDGPYIRSLNGNARPNA
jgi:hypothetical protein